MDTELGVGEENGMRLIDADVLKEDLTRFYDGEVTARQLIDAQPTVQPAPPEPCEDAISRQETIHAISDWIYDTTDERLPETVIRSLSAVQPEQKWIPCIKRMPEEHEWIGTKTFGTTISDEVYVTFESPKGERFTKHLSFQNGKVSSFTQREIDVFYKGAVPIAWMPLPEPYKGGDSE